ncbi:MAG: alkyl hydroperoxide reductase [Robiginitomaculum sp.]|nr:MAG: alkyl hydroperoxide reductase [Robiginitomaculum sp.]
MNFLKSVFVMAFITMAMVFSIYAVMQLAKGGNVMAWGGVLLANAPFMIRLSWIMLMKNTARTSARFPLFIALGVIGLLLSSYAWRNGADIHAMDMAVAGLVGFFLYSYWYSSFSGRGSDMLKTGQTLAPFSLLSASGNKVNSADMRGRPHILMFFRGNWCPLCMAQIKELAKTYQQIEACGARVALIAPQPHNNTKALAKKFDVDFDFYTDKGNKAARALGIANAWGIPFGMQVLGYSSETVLPTVIITDPDGKILWAHETDNYRVRPEPETFLAVLRDNGYCPA